MSKKSDKKLISLSNLALLDRLIKDEAELKHLSDSAVIEHHLLLAYLPQNKDARFWIENYLYSDNGSVRQTLQAVFSFNAAGIEWKSVHDNLQPLVKFALDQESLCSSSLTGNEKELYHCFSQIELIISKLAQHVDVSSDMEEKMYYKKEMDYISHLLNDLNESPQSFQIINLYQVLLRNWHVFKGYSITYRLLSDLVALSKNWINSPFARVELREIIKQVSSQWE